MAPLPTPSRKGGTSGQKFRPPRTTLMLINTKLTRRGRQEFLPRPYPVLSPAPNRHFRIKNPEIPPPPLDRRPWLRLQSI